MHEENCFLSVEGCFPPFGLIWEFARVVCWRRAGPRLGGKFKVAARAFLASLFRCLVEAPRKGLKLRAVAPRGEGRRQSQIASLHPSTKDVGAVRSPTMVGLCAINESKAWLLAGPSRIHHALSRKPEDSWNFAPPTLPRVRWGRVRPAVSGHLAHPLIIDEGCWSC